MPPLPQTTLPPPPLRWRTLAYGAVVAVAVLAVWLGPKLLGGGAGSPPPPAPALDLRELDRLSQSFGGWQALWQDPRFSELQVVAELVPVVPGNDAPFNRPKQPQ